MQEQAENMLAADPAVAPGTVGAAEAGAATAEVAEVALPELPGAAYTEVTYHFRTEKLRDEEGKVIGPGEKRPSATFKLPLPTADGILDIVAAGGKGLELLLEAVAAVVIEQGRELVAADKQITQATLDISKLTWEYISNIPKAQRGGTGISKEVWDEFAKDYIATIGATGKFTDEQVKSHARLLSAKFQPVKTNKQIVNGLRGLLGMWFEATANKEDFADCYEYLDSRAETLLNTDEQALLANLGL